MSTSVIVYVLTALAAVVVILTRLRLGRESGDAGRLNMGRGLVDLHTVAGVLALITWTVFLVADEDSVFGGAVVGIVALAFWWVTTLAGLVILMRWRRSRGRHATVGAASAWYDPWLSILAHVGMLLGVCFFTWAYLTSAV